MKDWVRHIFSFSLLWIVMVLQAQIITVQSKLSSDSMMIGDQLLFTIHVESARDVAFRMPMVSDTLSRDLEVLAPFRADTARTGPPMPVPRRLLAATGSRMLHE